MTQEDCKYYLSGQLYSLERYSDGQMHLAQEYYYPDGSLKTLIHYNYGILDGETRLYWPNGKLKRQCSFNLGKKEFDLFYDEEGSLIEDLC